MKNKNISTLIKEEIDNSFSELIDIRRYLHMHPELSNKEYETSKYIKAYLDSLNIPSKIVVETGVYGVINESSTGPKIILRADIDALPITEENNVSYKSLNNGVMHACGHDCHTACLMLAAKILKSHEKELIGKVELHFQPAEEIGAGARKFIEEGYLDNRDYCFGLHIAPYLKCGDVLLMEGANNASVDYFKINIKGKSSHICEPAKGIDALGICALIVTKLKVIAENKKAKDNVLIGMGKMSAGTQYNIVAEDGYIEGTIRCFDEEIRKDIKKLIEEEVYTIASLNNAKSSIEWKDYTSSLINSPDTTKYLQDVMIDTLGKNHIITKKEPSYTGDDFAEYIRRCPGTYLYLGSSNENIQTTLLPQHNSKLDVDEECLKIGTLADVIAAFSLLEK